MRHNALKTTVPLAITTIICNCTTVKKHSTTIEPDKNTKVYAVSRKAGDISTAITAVNYLACHSPDSIAYMDSAANLYFQIGAYNQCIYWCKSSLKHNDSNEYARFLLSRSYQNNMEQLKAIEGFEKLIQFNPLPEYYVHLAECQFLSKRLLECIKTTEQADSIPVNYKIKYHYKDTANKTCSSNLRSALLNFRGLAHYELGNIEAAIECFSKALSYDSTFLLSQYNLQISKRRKTQIPKAQE